MAADGAVERLAMGHITIDWWNDKTISYLMLEMHHRQWQRGEKKGENLISCGLALYTLHGQYGSTEGVVRTPLLYHCNQSLQAPLWFYYIKCLKDLDCSLAHLL